MQYNGIIMSINKLAQSVQVVAVVSGVVLSVMLFHYCPVKKFSLQIAT